MDNAEIPAEVHFAQKLASNEKKIRDRAIKRLRKYISARASHGGFSEADLVKIWKGIHYCMWMQDKPLLQEELCGKIVSLLRCFPSVGGALQFMEMCLETEGREWNGIDKLRLDKFMMMVREMLHETLALLSDAEWSNELCLRFAQGLSRRALDPAQPRLPDGLKLHLADIYVDEIGKVDMAKMRSRQMVLLLRPFIDFVIYTPKIELCRRVLKEVIGKVLNTMSTISHLDDTSEEPTRGKNKGSRRVNKTDDDEMDMEDGGEDGDEDDVDEDKDDEEMLEEVENVDDDVPSNKQTFTLDAEMLLIVLLQLAKGSKVKAANRAIVYNLVKKHPEVFQNVLNTISSLADGKIKSKDDEEGVHLAELELFHTDGQSEDNKQQQKKKKKKRKENETAASSEVIKHQTVAEEGDSVSLSKKKKKKKNKESKVVETEVSEGGESAKTKKLKRKRSLDKEDGDVTPGVDGSVSHTEQVEKGHKKKKRKLSSESSDNVSGVEDDKNSNARDGNPRRSSIDLFTTPVEMVIYPQKSPQPAKTKTKPGKGDRCNGKPEVDENKRETKKSKRGSSSTPDRNSYQSLRSPTPTSMAHTMQRSPTPTSMAHTMQRSPTPTSMARTMQRSPESPTSRKTVTRTDLNSMSLAASLYTVSADRKKNSKKASRRSSPDKGDEAAIVVGRSVESSCGESGDAPTAFVPEIGASCGSCGPRITTSSSPASVMSVLTSIKEKLVDPLLPVSVTGAFGKDKDDVSECSMDWSAASTNDRSSMAMSIQEADTGDDDTLSDRCHSYTDPGPDRKKKKAKCDDTDDSSGFLTPLMKKKVVFDLRKNRANKFTDYVRSLQRQPESPHIPGRSPSSSILKVGPSRSSSNSSVGSRSPGKSKKSRSPKKKSMSPSPSPKSKPKKAKSARSRSNTRLG